MEGSKQERQNQFDAIRSELHNDIDREKLQSCASKSSFLPVNVSSAVFKCYREKLATLYEISIDAGDPKPDGGAQPALASSHLGVDTNQSARLALGKRTRCSGSEHAAVIRTTQFFVLHNTFEFGIGSIACGCNAK